MSLDLLKLQERVQIAISLGESHFREFKSAQDGPPGRRIARDPRDVSQDIARTLVAFANADGGELLVGVEDDGQVTGVAYSESQLEMISAAPKTHVLNKTPLPSTRMARVEFQGKTVVYFSVPKGTEYVYLTADGRCLQRKDRDSLPIPVETIVLARTEQASREYDRAFVDGATVDDLDIRLINEVANRISKGMSAEKCLQHLDLAEFDGFSFRLRRAALLLFARSPNKWHPRSQVRLLKIKGNELKSGEDYNVTIDQEVTDNVLRLIETSWDLVRPHLTETRLSPSAVFKTQIIYPEAACREALLNALAHRDYSIEGRGVEVHVYDDRLMVTSPGGLLSSIAVEDLIKQKGVHQSRNSFLARVLREVGYMRELGEGMRRIYELMQSSDLAPPEIVTDSSSFSIALHQKYVYSKEERLWLDKFTRLELTREQKTVVRLGYDDHIVSAKDIWEAVGIVDTDAYRRLIESMRRIGVLTDALTRKDVEKLARKRRITRKAVPRYVIHAPATPTTTHFPKETSVAPQTDETEYARVFVGNIPLEVTELQLVEAFQPYGDVVDVVIPLDRVSGHNRAFAFVEFESLDAARKAIDNTGGVEIDGRRLYVRLAKPRIGGD